MHHSSDLWEVLNISSPAQSETESIVKWICEFGPNLIIFEKFTCDATKTNHNKLIRLDVSLLCNVLPASIVVIESNELNTRLNTLHLICVVNDVSNVVTIHLFRRL